MVGDWGARLLSVEVPVESRYLPVLLGHRKLTDYRSDLAYMGATVGPVANRIRQGKIRIDRQEFQLPRNEGSNALHSGKAGLDCRTWLAVNVSKNSVSFVLEYVEGISGLPGNLTIEVRYEVMGDALIISTRASSDRKTYLNVTSHGYYNLNGIESGDIKNHGFRLYGESYHSMDVEQLPSGNVVALDDLLEIERLGNEHWDTHFCCPKHAANTKLRPLAEAWSPKSGLMMEVWSTKPGYQFYTGQHLAYPFQSHGGFCVESQYEPDWPNSDPVSAAMVVPGRAYYHQTQYRFRLP